MAFEISAVVQDGLHPANISEGWNIPGTGGSAGGAGGAEENAKVRHENHTLGEGRVGALGLRRVNRKRTPVLAEPRQTGFFFVSYEISDLQAFPRLGMEVCVPSAPSWSRRPFRGDHVSDNGGSRGAITHVSFAVR